MRTETDKFFTQDSTDYCVEAKVDCDGDVCIELDHGYEWTYITKQQAAEFARQILEMCGDGGDE